MSAEIFTFGHAAHGISHFVRHLHAAGITHLIDVRSKPFSWRSPHFNKNQLKAAMDEVGIDYRWMGTILGGFSPCSVHTLPFKLKMGAIATMARQGHRPVMICAELNPAECHRAGKLTAWVHRNCDDIKTTHILNGGEVLDGREFEPQVLPRIMWREYKD